MKFFAIRYFSVKASITLFPLDKGMKPRDLFTTPIFKKSETNYYKRTYTARVLNENDDDNVILGYLLKSTDTHIIELDQELFNEEDVKNWEKLFFILDRERQIIAFEHNSNVATPDNVKNVLLKLTTAYANSFGYDIKLDFLIDKFAFWDIIEKSNGLYQVAFDLNSPNLFGGSKKANEWLATLKEKHNMTKVSVDFRNESGDLTYNEEEMESYRDYADSGGGNWTLGVIEKNKKRKYKSENHLRRKEIDFNADNPKTIKENIFFLVNKFKELIINIDDK
ncbi:hypothetical protein WH52_05095 [Tenacibaculum holothuriorum]|uniref:DUF4747 domain-containing protein n=1 Tax=Tenacibaculum holothuriorum TaxID=1635173 RepID=A0A1Y2PH82_9FLAO|nr:hypothetical protein [Tenacibaculum holothuriorum]OSY89038.1 hypothetical protein WH52_05095 [Tenacibaculum holothuriorum]